MTRRAFIRGSLLAGLGLCTAGLLASCSSAPAASPTSAPARPAEAAKPTEAAKPAASPAAASASTAAAGSPAAAASPATSASPAVIASPSAAASPAAGASSPAPKPIAADPSAKKGGTYTFGTGQGISTLDPHKPALLNDRNIYSGLYNGLVKMTGKMELEPDLAESWQVVDPITYVFKLRRGVKFHNGREMTADDVKFSFDRAADPATASRWKGFSLPQYDRMEVVDPYTVKLVNKSPFPPQLDALGQFKIVAKENVGDLTTRPIGTGPFKMTEFVQDDRLVMEKFADSWEAPRVNLDKVIIKTVKDATALQQALKTGAVDSIWQMPTRDAEEVKASDKLELYQPEFNAIVQMLMIDNNEAPFNDPRARMALSYATDRASFNDVAFFGMFELHEYNVPLPSNNWAFNPKTPKATYDLQKAKELFTAAGVNAGTTLTFQAISTANPEWVVVGEILQQSLSEIGLKMQIEKLDLAAWGAVFNPADQKKWPARVITNGNVGYSDPFFFFQTFQEGLLNRNHYQNKEVQALIDKAAVSVDRSERMSLYGQAQEKMAADPPCPMPYVQRGLYGKAKALKGFYAEADWVPHFEYAWLDR
jgi:peptide/nickel transport system substrate-binding protein